MYVYLGKSIEIFEFFISFKNAIILGKICWENFMLGPCWKTTLNDCIKSIMSDYSQPNFKAIRP